MHNIFRLAWPRRPLDKHFVCELCVCVWVCVPNVIGKLRSKKAVYCIARYFEFGMCPRQQHFENSLIRARETQRRPCFGIHQFARAERCAINRMANDVI